MNRNESSHKGSRPDFLERLWAPYRQSYIVSDGRKEVRDPFVVIPEMEDREGLIVARGTYVYAVLNKFPYNSGHLLVVPYRKVADLEDLSDDEYEELVNWARIAVRVIRSVSSPDAMNVGFNLGRASGGSVGEHLHLHIVPRWCGDANFMTIIDATKVLPQTLQHTRDILAEAWAAADWAPGEVVLGDTDAKR